MVIKAVVFDLEGTLFSSEALAQEHMSHVLNLLSTKKQTNIEITQDQMKSKREELAEELRYNPPLTMLTEAFGISREEFYDEIGKVDPHNYLKPDVKVQRVLKLLKSRGFKLALLTNISYKYTTRILRSLHIEISIFDYVITGNDVLHVKPHSEPFDLILKRLNLASKHVLMVGDRVYIDLLPAKKLGMKTALISKHHASIHINTKLVDVVLHEVHDLIQYLKLTSK